MENKTISNLNTKIWYRLIKVVYLLFFVLLFVGYNFFVFSNPIKKLDLDKTIVTCYINLSNYGNPPTASFTLQSVKRYFINNEFDNYNYADFIKNNENDASAIADKCIESNPQDITIASFGLPSSQPVYMTRAEYEAKYGEPPSDYQKNPSGFDETYAPIPISAYFSIKPIYSYAEFIELLLIGNLVITLLFFLTRGIFYYVALGKIRPEK